MIISYTVKYRKLGDFFWSKIKDVEGDDTSPDGKRICFFKVSGERVEVPLEGLEVSYSKERFKLIQHKMEQESGLKMAAK